MKSTTSLVGFAKIKESKLGVSPESFAVITVVEFVVLYVRLFSEALDFDVFVACDGVGSGD